MLNIKTDKMKEKDKYKNLVQIIGDLLKVKGNEWLIDEVLRVVRQSHPIDKIADYPLINEIYEHCIKEVIKKQANDFYSKFPIKDQGLMRELTCAFEEMEYNRRRDRFYEFSFNLYQQMEGITNYLFEKKYKNEWEKLDDSIKNQKKEGSYYYGSETIRDLVRPKPKNWYLNNKFCVVYYIMDRQYQIKRLKEGKDYFSADLTRMAKIQHLLGIARNEAHLGSDRSPLQEKMFQQIKGNESRYYFKFYAFLEEFISKIESSYNPKDSQGPLQNQHKDTKGGQKKKEGKKYSKKKSGNSHLQNNKMFAHLGLKKKVQQKARENKENK
jgi:hypothetical protein